MSKYVYIWEYHVKKEFINKFEETYSPHGIWVSLFKKADGYLETHFFEDKTDPSRYVTVDYWISHEAYQIFRKNFENEFEKLDKMCEEYTIEEKKIGDFRIIE